MGKKQKVIRPSNVSKNKGQEILPEKQLHDTTPLYSECVLEGKQFGKYIIEKKLGSGGMGSVFKAYHPKLDSYFALKLVLPENVGEEGIQRFEREARVSSKLKHPNIVSVHDVGAREGKHYIVMDYIEGKNLKDLIRESRIWPRRAFDIMLQLTRALRYSHDQGIIHRDIKPSNIMIAEKEGKEVAYLMDFGIASVVKEEGLTRTGQIMGTPQYMSPEQSRGAKDVDARSDIYSLGAVLYEMLSGKPAVEDNNVMVMLYNVLHIDPPMVSALVPGIAKDVEAITMKCIEKDVSRRYQTAGELADDIERYIRGEAILACSPGYLYRLWRKATHNWKFAGLLLALICILIVGVIMWKIISQRHAEELENTREVIWDELEKQENLENFDKASELCQRLIGLDQADIRFSKKLVDITQKEKAYQQKQEVIRLEKEAKRKEARKYYDRAMEVFWNPRLEKKELERCHELFEEATKKDPEFADAHFQAGRASHRLFLLNKAGKHYQDSLKHEHNLTAPKYYLTALDISRKIMEIGELKPDLIDIIQDIKVPQNAQDSTDPYDLLANAQLLLPHAKWGEVKYWDKCLEDCNKVIKDNQNFSDAYFIRAQLYSYPIAIGKNGFWKLYFTPDTKKDMVQALKDCTKGIYLDPYRIEGYALRGTIYKLIGAYDLAEKDFTKAILLKIPTAGFYRDRAICYIAMGKWDLAMGDIEENMKLLEPPQGTSKENIRHQSSTRDAFLWQTLIKALLGHKKEAEEELNQYISVRPSKNSQYDGFLKGLIYTYIDKQIDRAEKSFHDFFIANKGLMLLLQSFLRGISIGQNPDHCIQRVTLFFQGVPNLFCADPNIKAMVEGDKAVQQLITFTKNLPIVRNAVDDPEVEFSTVLRACLENIKKTDGGEEKEKRINLIFNKEYPPITADIFMYCVDYLNEQNKIKIMLTMNALPSSLLYYRRAIEYYFKAKFNKDSKKKELENARQDLEDALELEPCFVEAHYGLATVYSLLSSIENIDSEKKSNYIKQAVYHLREAVENGWDHIEDYTLKDDDFAPMGLGKEISLDTLRSWNQKRQEKEKQIQNFENRVKDLISGGKPVTALKLLYELDIIFHDHFKDLIETAEEKTMQQIGKELNNETEDMLKSKIEGMLGERGQLILEWAKNKKGSK